jgi:hypothetical protein
VLDLSEALERSSLIQLDSAGLGPRLRMLNVIRGFGRAVQAAQRASIGGGFRQHGPAPIRKRPAPLEASGQA